MAERNQRLIEGLYVCTLGLLAAHQIDSAFWQEWDLFGMPGGIQVFVLVNVALILPFLYGLTCLVREPRTGAPYGVVLSGVGVFAFLIHMWFFAQGRPEFRAPVSIVVLVVTLGTSMALGWQSVKVLREQARERAPS